MEDDFLQDGLPEHGKPIDPVAMAQKDLKKALPKRFYKEATAEARDGAFVILLDGRPVKTPAKNALALPGVAAAQAVAEEWQNQEEYIDPGFMPLTRLAHSALDAVVREKDACVQEIVKYAGSDLVCYRASDPAGLVQAQAEAWDPYLNFAREKFGARFICAEGIVFAAQPEPALRAIHKAVQAFADAEPAGPFLLAALNVITSLTGSALIALGVVHGEFDAASAWHAAHVDEDFQMRIWGHDEEALQRRARRWIDMEQSVKLFRLVQDEEFKG